MAYATTNPPKCLVDELGGIDAVSHREWTYVAAETAATVQIDGYFSDGYFLGMRVGNPVTIVDITNPAAAIVSRAVVTSVNAATGAVDLGDVTADATGAVDTN